MDVPVNCLRLIDEFQSRLRHVKNRKFDEEPDHSLIRMQFRGRLEENKCQYDTNFDWVIGDLAEETKSSGQIENYDEKNMEIFKNKNKEIKNEGIDSTEINPNDLPGIINVTIIEIKQSEPIPAIETSSPIEEYTKKNQTKGKKCRGFQESRTY